MPVDALLAALTPEARVEAIDVGSQFNKDEVLSQISVTQAAYARSGAELAQHGFTAEDAAELGELEDAVRSATDERTGANLTTRAGRIAYRRLVTQAKGAVKNGTSVLRNLAATVARKPDPANPTAAAQLTAALAVSGPVGRSYGKISDQLDVLLKAFNEVAIAKVGESRGGPEAKAKLEHARRELDAGRPANLAPTGTPTETQAQNLIEGLAVQYLRAARKAARAAADRLGDPALAKAYELQFLYNSDSRRSGGAAGDGPALPPLTPTP